MKRLSSIAAVVLLLSTLSGCADMFQARSQLSDLRVLAIESSPVEVVAGAPVTLSPTVFVPDGQAITSLTWSFCPFSIGAQAAYQCLAPECEFPLQPAADGSVTANPTLLLVECVQALADLGGGQPDGSPGEIPDSVETLFRLKVATDAGEEREAVRRVKVWTKGAPASPNRPPVIARIELDGLELRPGRPVERSLGLDVASNLRVLVEPSSLDEYVDGNGQTRTEDPVVSIYATAGGFSGDRTSGLDDSVEWTVESEGLAPGANEARLYFVVRDLRGGESVSGPYLVAINR